MKNQILSFLLLYSSCLFLAGCNEEETQQTIDQQLIAPYFALIKQGKYEEAYQSYTSDNYKKYSSLKDYTESYQKNIAKRGGLESYSIHKVQYLTQLFGKDEIRGEISFRFKNEKYAKPILFIISQYPNGKYLIDAAWHDKKYANSDGLDGPF
ncbi:MAG: hypothetical protein ACK4GN_15145 [Runella sp.]